MSTLRLLTRGLSSEESSELEKRIADYDRSVDSTDEAGPEVDLIVLRSADEGLQELVDLRNSGTSAPAVVVWEGEGCPSLTLERHGATLLDDGELLRDGDRVGRALAQTELLARLQQQFSTLGGQLRRAEEEEFHLRLEAEELRRRLDAADAEEPLTGLRSERAMARSVEEAFNLARRHQTPVACLAIGIDGYAALEERFGAAFAEFVTEQIAHRLHTCLRNTDLMSRYRTGEFLVLSPFNSPEGAASLRDRLREAASAQRLEHEGERLDLSVSVGVSNFDLDMQTSSALVEGASAALEAARAGD